MIWTPEETIRFIKLYEKEPAIWDERSPLYKEKDKVNEAWERIEEEMEIPVVDLKRRKESLMTAFRLNYKRKVYQGFKPTWTFYNIMESFLKDVCEYRITNKPNSFMSTPPPLRKLKHKKIKRARSEDSIEDCQEDNSEEMSQVLNTLNYVLEKKNIKSPEEEQQAECELYGKLISKRLLAFPYQERQELMYAIDGIILKHRLERGIGEEVIDISKIKRSRSSESLDSSPTHIIYRPPSESE